MNKIYLHFKSSVPFEFLLNGEFVEICNENESIDLEVKNNQNFYFSFNPISENIQFLPYTQKLEILNNEVICNNKEVKILKFTNNHFEIILTPYLYLNDTNKLITKNLGNIYVCVQTNNKIIYFYENNVLKNQINTSKIITNSTIKQINNFIILKNSLISNQFEVCIVDVNTLKCVYQSICESIEENKENIKILKQVNSNSNYAIVITFNTTNGDISTNSVFLSKTINSPILEIKAYQFLLAIQHNDLKTALTLTTQNLNKNLNSDNIKNYFGKITNIYFDSYNNEDIIFLIENENNSYKKFKFNFDNKLISDLEDDI